MLDWPIPAVYRSVRLSVYRLRNMRDTKCCINVPMYHTCASTNKFRSNPLFIFCRNIHIFIGSISFHECLLTPKPYTEKVCIDRRLAGNPTFLFHVKDCTNSNINTNSISNVYLIAHS